ncbi:MAG: hypothetical protein GXP29_01695 [Planctomycetes bacterium]|nr:hypothetical protein [Planctomycetota bacterium]
MAQDSKPKEEKNKNETLGEYEATCHVVVSEAGHLYAPTDENVTAGLPSRCVLDDSAARRYGDCLKRVGNAAKGAERNKMVTDAVDK